MTIKKKTCRLIVDSINPRLLNHDAEMTKAWWYGKRAHWYAEGLGTKSGHQQDAARNPTCGQYECDQRQVHARGGTHPSPAKTARGCNVYGSPQAGGIDTQAPQKHWGDSHSFADLLTEPPWRYFALMKQPSSLSTGLLVRTPVIETSMLSILMKR